ncbi:benzoate 4-monooxygenase cytochrome P450 [Colletotrichum sublineola]|uniref:Putative benzoate 4-monooxygenase cytochrome P450 n=1 Tax=Colletotrichum sublineola TaxID=1173701 RepID=A0A066Y0J0_COLSU|nr:benzoate 4-monooxygenase cytochrome P450 [Colletotrichum sublineola]KDN71690.1 putative benzoate 4-monooxygenase cytochrome P450 [Colletotrichum sublineola]
MKSPIVVLEYGRNHTEAAVLFFWHYWPVLVPLLLWLHVLRTRYVSPLCQYPGPFLASVTRLWKIISTASRRTHLDHIALHRKYGPVVRIAPNEVSIASPEAARYILSAGKRFHKTAFYTVFSPPGNPSIFTEIDEEAHARKRRVVNIPYSMAAIQQLSPFIDDTIDTLVAKLSSFAKQPEVCNARESVDLGVWLHYFAFDVLGEVAFSRSFGFLAEGRDVEDAIATINRDHVYKGIVGQVPWIDHILRRNPLWNLVPTLSLKNALIPRIASGEIDRRRPFTMDSAGKLRTDNGREDLLASLIKGHLQAPGNFTEGDVFAVSHGAIFAGSDSTASTMQSLCWHVLSSTQVHAKLVAEVADAVKSGVLSATGNVSWKEAQQLPYFQACLREAMRLRPAVGLNITRVVPPEGTELIGHFFPGGTQVAVNGWVLHRDKRIFGQDADDYRPERWLVSVEKAKQMDRYMFQFGGGSHVCLGRNLALLEINKVVPRLFRDFKFELASLGRPLTANATFFVLQDGLDVFLERRQLA